jgi:tetratricopeptide (TPR) repeat protein
LRVALCNALDGASPGNVVHAPVAASPLATTLPAASQSAVGTPLRGEIAPVKPEGPPAGRARIAWVVAGVVGAAGIAVAVHQLGGLQPKEKEKHGTGSQPSRNAPEQSLSKPQLGLRALDQFHDATGSHRSLLSGVEGWDAATGDLERSASQPGAPPRWRAGAAFSRGYAALQRGQLDEAGRRLGEAIAIDGQWSTPHVGLAEVTHLQGHFDEALKELRRAEELEPTWWLPVATAGAFYAHASRDDESVQEYRRALSLAPDEPAILDALALELHKAHMDDQAASFAERALKRDPDMVWSHLLLAERALEHSDGATALAESSHATSVAPTSAAAQLARADALALLHQKAEAMDVYKHVVELVDSTHQQGLPAGRVDLVRKALRHGTVPPPRVGERSAPSRSAPSRSAPPRSAPKGVDNIGF